MVGWQSITMCKNPASECKPIQEDNAQAEDDDAMSEDESESTDVEVSYFTESSVDNRTDSDSDAESASGNRVTSEMVLLLMLKEHGAITEAQYDEKAEKCEDNIKALVPIIPRSASLDGIDYTRIDEESNEGNSDNCKVDVDLREKLLQELIGDTVEATNGSEVTHKNINSVEKDESKDVESIEKFTDVKENSTSDLFETGTLQDGISNTNGSAIESRTNMDTAAKDGLKIMKPLERGTHVKQNYVSDWLLSNANTYQDGVNKEQHNGEPIIQQQVTIIVNQNKYSEEEMKDLLQNKVLLKVIQGEPYQEQPATVRCEAILSENSVDKTVTEVPDNGCGKHTASENMFVKVENTKNMRMEIDNDSLRQFKDDSITENQLENHLDENTLGVLEDASIETNNNTRQDTALIKTDKESRKDLNTKNEINTTGKITKSFRYILNKLLRENRIIEEEDEDRISDEYGETYAETLRSFVNRLDDHYGPDMTASKMSVSDDDDDYYDAGLKEFALYLNFYSPSSYKYILETFNTPLPEHRVLCSWYLKDDNEPGLTERAFNILKQKSAEKRLTCSLMFIDIFLKNHGRYYDQVDYGAGPNDGCVDKAVLAYVFVLVSLDEDWKMPIGYIYARNVPAETQAELIRICLTQCHDSGADVVAVTLETLTPAEFLGCSFQDPKNLKTTFKHPVCDREVAVWIDPCLALKSARQTLKVKGALLDDQGNRVKWNLIRKLIRLHSDDLINYEKKPEFFELRNHIAKVGLTTETFSKSLAPALELSEKFLPDLFTDTEPTRRFILFINMIYSILNSRVTTRMRYIVHNLQAARRYLIRIFRNEDNELSPYDRVNLGWGNTKKGYRFLLGGEAACGFLGFLICIESFKHLYTTLVKKDKRLNSLNPQRLCKGRAEDFVTTLRVHNCWNPEYFSGEDFQRYYNKLFEALEKNPLFSDKSISLEHWSLQDRYPPAVTIKLTAGKRSYDDIYSSQYKLKKLRKTFDEKHATKLVREYSKDLDIEKNLLTRKNMVGYIAGWIAAKFAKCLRCEACIDALCTDKKLGFHKFITLKQIYAVCLPSEEVFRICWECERALRLKRTPASVRAWVLRRLAPKFPWSSRIAKHPTGHHIQLARAVIAKYVPLRIPAPFSSKERIRIINMFKRFTLKDDNGSDSYDELAAWMEFSSGEDDYDSRDELW